MSPHDKLRQLRRLFVERSESDRLELERACRERDRETLRHLAHGLAGNGGLFGFPAISASARALELALAEDADWDRLGAACEALIAAMRATDQRG
jgi:HPt (histidine-containing phosphotransfer) domain-containing protein